MSDFKVHEKLDKLDDRLNNIDVHLAKYNEQLVYHIDRTDRLEAMVVDQGEALKPLQAHVSQWQGVGQAIYWASIVVGALGALSGLVAWVINGQ